jgi:hypothetical protein
MMPFKLCNVLSTFTTFTNFIFHGKLDEFMMIYINNILVYSKMIEEHVKNFEYVLNNLHKSKLFANKVKNEFAKKKMDFLRHILSREKAKPNLKKL